MTPGIRVFHLLSAFTKWLAKNPIDGDPLCSRHSVQYQVARYCEYLVANPWSGGDPLLDPRQRRGAVNAYAAYLETFNTSSVTIDLVRKSLERFHLFLGTGTARTPQPSTP